MGIGIEYYGFALFISALLCLIAILCKVLFSNVRRQRKLLDEKETKLLQLYQTVESIMEDFNDQARATTEDIKEYEHRAAISAAAAASMSETVRYEQSERLPRAEKAESSRLRAASEMLARAERIVNIDVQRSSPPAARPDNKVVFQRLFDDTAREAQAEIKTPPAKQNRSELILGLAEEGKTDAQIARELGITQNEVNLVIGLTRRK